MVRGKTGNAAKSQGKQPMAEGPSRRYSRTPPRDEFEEEMEELEHNSQFDDVSDEFTNNQGNHDEEVQEPVPPEPPRAPMDDNRPNNMIRAMEAAFNRMAQGIGGRREESWAASALRQAKTMDPPTFKGEEEPIESSR